MKYQVIRGRNPSKPIQFGPNLTSAFAFCTYFKLDSFSKWLGRQHYLYQNCLKRNEVANYGVKILKTNHLGQMTKTDSSFLPFSD